MRLFCLERAQRLNYTKHVGAFVSVLPETVECGAANGYFVEIRDHIASRTVRRVTAMVIVDAQQLHDLSVSWLITRKAADDLHHHCKKSRR